MKRSCFMVMLAMLPWLSGLGQSCEYATLTVDSFPAVQPGLTTYRVYIDLPDSSQFVGTVGALASGMLLTVPSGVYNSEFGGVTAELLNPELFSFFPELQDDSFVTIGLDGPAYLSENQPAFTPEVGGVLSAMAFFQDEGGTELVVTNSIDSLGNPGFRWVLPGLFVNQGADENGRVLLMQVTTPGAFSGMLSIRLKSIGNDGYAITGNELTGTFDGAGTFALTGYRGCLDPASCIYDPCADTEGSCEVRGCGDVNACNYDSCVTFNSSWACDYDCIGCTVPEACNYDVEHTVEDESCLYFFDECGICGGDNSNCSGCTDSIACNYNPSVSFDDGSCLVLDVIGECGGTCQSDYNNNGICDDQEVNGCTYILAENFDSDATDDDGSCIFPCEGVVNTNVFDWDGDYVVTVTDFLMMLSVYGDTDVDLDGVWDSGDDCVDSSACNYANDPSEPCAYIDILGICGGGCEADEDSDGICDDIDTCVGIEDECGVCNGPGPNEIVIDQIITTYDSIFLPVDGEWFVYAVEVDTTFSITCAQDENLVINELNWVTGPDNGQFVELYGEPGLDLSGHSVVFVRPVFQSGGVYEAQVDFVVGLDGQSLDADGFALVDGFSLIGNVVGVVLAASPAGDFVEGEVAMFEDVVDAILYGNLGPTHPQMSPLVASINPLATGALNESGDGVFPGTDGLARVPDGGEPMDQMFVLQANSPGTTNQLPNEMHFTCSDPLGYQGYDYATVLIGEQCWFAENLRSENYENGDAIPAGLSSSEWSDDNSGAVAVYGEGSSTCYNYSPDGDACDDMWSLNQYGRLYNWYAVDDARGLCPSGWHVPTDGEWTVMTDVLDGESVAGGQMKTTYGWYVGGNGTNSSVFSGLPGGFRNYVGYFYDAGGLGYWWSSSPDGFGAWYRSLGFNSENVNRYDDFNLRSGFSVRCVEDAE